MNKVFNQTGVLAPVAILSAAIVGGAIVPPLFGLIADSAAGGGGIHALRLAFALPVLCYAYILWYGLRGHQPVALHAAGEVPVALV